MRKVPNPPVFAIGLTGGISSGKSVAGEYLRRYFKVMDADALVHDLYQSDSSLIADIAHEFGENCVRNGRVDRKTLGNLVFKNPRSLDRLNSIVHPIVGKRLTDEIERARSEKEITVFLIPLLFEHHWQEKLDSVVLVGCSPATQLARILSRDQRSEEEARARRKAGSL